MTEIGLAVLLVTLATAAFGISIWVGILVGRRLDRIVEAHAAPADAGSAETRPDEEVRAHGE